MAGWLLWLNFPGQSGSCFTVVACQVQPSPPRVHSTPPLPLPLPLANPRHPPPTRLTPASGRSPKNNQFCYNGTLLRGLPPAPTPAPSQRSASKFDDAASARGRDFMMRTAGARIMSISGARRAQTSPGLPADAHDAGFWGAKMGMGGTTARWCTNSRCPHLAQPLNNV